MDVCSLLESDDELDYELSQPRYDDDELFDNDGDAGDVGYERLDSPVAGEAIHGQAFNQAPGAPASSVEIDVEIVKETTGGSKGTKQLTLAGAFGLFSSKTKRSAAVSQGLDSSDNQLGELP